MEKIQICNVNLEAIYDNVGNCYIRGGASFSGDSYDNINFRFDAYDDKKMYLLNGEKCFWIQESFENVLENIYEVSESGYITGIYPGQNTVQEITDNCCQDSLICRDAGGNLIPNDALLTTGSNISKSDKNGLEIKYTVIILGDICQDGKIDGKDVSKLLQYRLGKIDCIG